MLVLDTLFVCNTVYCLSKEVTCFVELIYLHYPALMVHFSRWTCTASLYLPSTNINLFASLIVRFYFSTSQLTQHVLDIPSKKRNRAKIIIAVVFLWKWSQSVNQWLTSLSTGVSFVKSPSVEQVWLVSV